MALVSWYVLPSLLGVFVSMGLGLFVLYKRGKDAAGKIFFLLMIACTGWNLGEFMMHTSSIATHALFWGKVANIGFVLIPAILLHFTFIYPRRTGRGFHILYLPAFFLIALLFLTNTVFIVEPVKGVERFKYVAKEFYSLLLILFFAYIIGAILNLLKRRGGLKGRDREQNTHLSIGLLAILGYIWVEFYVAFFIPFIVLDCFLTLLIASFFTYVTIKYQLFDIKLHLFFRNTLIYSTLFTIVVGLFLIIIIFSTVVMGGGILSQPFFYIGCFFLISAFLKKMDKGATAVVETLFPALKWRESKVGEVFLIYRENGTVISHVEVSAQIKIDPDLVAGMLTAVQDFLEDTLRTGKRLNVLSYGGTKILLEWGRYAYMVVIFTGYEVEEMRTDIQEVMRTIDEKYSKLLSRWDGDAEKVKCVGESIKSMLR